MNSTSQPILVSADLVNPTFASNMRANCFSRQRAAYLQQHDRRMREFKDRPYLKHEYPEIPAHRPGTWQAYRWTEIDNVVSRLSKLPDRWVTHLNRRRATSPSVAGPLTRRSQTFVKRSKESNDYIDKLSRPKSTPPRQTETVFYIGGKQKERFKKPESPKVNDKSSSNVQETCSVKGILIEKDDDQESDRFRPASRSPDKIRFADFRSRSVEPTSESGEKRKVDFLQNESKSKTNPVQSKEIYAAPKTILLRCKSAPPRKATHAEQPPSRPADVEVKSESKSVQFSESLFPDECKGGDAGTTAVVEANMKFGYSKRRPSIISRTFESSPKTTTTEEQHWSFDRRAASYVSSVLGLLQTVTSNNGRIRPSSAMANYREKFPQRT